MGTRFIKDTSDNEDQSLVSAHSPAASSSNSKTYCISMVKDAKQEALETRTFTIEFKEPRTEGKAFKFLQIKVIRLRGA